MRQVWKLIFLWCILCKNAVANAAFSKTTESTSSVTTESTSSVTTESTSSVTTENSITTFSNNENINTNIVTAILGNILQDTETTTITYRSTSNNPHTTNYISTISFINAATQTQCSAPDPPELRYSNLIVSCSSHQSDIDCIPQSLNFTCIPNKNTYDVRMFIIDNSLDVPFFKWNITNEQYGLQKGTQYNCTVGIGMQNDTTSDFTSIIVPPGNLEINVSVNGKYLNWTKPFYNDALTYNIEGKRLIPNHYVPPDCENHSNNTFTYNTTETSLEMVGCPADFNCSVVISTEFWNISITNSTSFSTPTTAPGIPRNVSVDYYLDKSNERQFKLKFFMPCDPNESIKSYDVRITNQNTEEVIEDSVPNLENRSNYSLLLTNLSKVTDYKLEIYAVGVDNKIGASYEGNFSTANGLPDAPNVTIIETGSKNFTIHWTIPENFVGDNLSQIFDFLIEINALDANYTREETCPTPNNSSKNVPNNITSYIFDAAWPSYNYNVTVMARISESEGSIGYATLTTNSFIPDAPENLTLLVDNNETLDSRLIWKIPCNVNGIIQFVQVNVSKQYTEEVTTNIKTYNQNSSELSLNLSLKPSHIYEINATILLVDETLGQISNLTYKTEAGFPGAPILSSLIVSNTSFIITWKPPEEKNGPIQFYEINITSLNPLYHIPEGCSPKAYSNFSTKSGTTLNIIYNMVLPYHTYEVKIRANTTRGYGNFSTTVFNTTEAVPENVRNITFAIDNPESEQYNASVSISYDLPCNTYGSSINYKLVYSGTRDSYPEDQGTLSVYDKNVNFKFNLKPEFHYTYYITTINQEFSNTTQNYFVAPAGVPTFNDNIPIVITSITTEKARIILKEDIFNSSNGVVKYIALIRTEGFPLPMNNSIVPWDGNKWPQVDGTQLTDCFWNPFDKKKEIEFIIGDDLNCSSNCGCNTPLKQDTTYYVTVRAFNGNFFRNGPSKSFRTHALSHLGVILGVIFGILAIAIMGLMGFFIWKKKIYKKLSYIYPRKQFIKPLGQSSTAVTTKKFNHYFKHTQNKPELLKEQFAELAEKSQEIKLQKTTQFAALLENKRKNRYVNISPYDDTRVKLLIDEDDEIGSDYINATYVKGYSGAVEYIATQGPLISTCRDFWKMVLQENVNIIVMVSQFVEKNKDKCYKYFPKNHENLIIGDDMEIRCSTELHFGTYIVRNLQVRKDNLQVTVTHMQFVEWPDFNVPTGTEHMLQFIYKLRERVRIEGGLIIVHCSAGVGRTGTLIAADMLLQNANAGKQIDIFNIVLELRRQRVMMVQTLEQYIYLHRLIADHIDGPPTPDIIEASDPVYENMDILQKQTENQHSLKRKEEESQF